MSETCLDKVMDALMAIPKDDVKCPTMPVSVYFQEAENLKIWAEEDRVSGTGLLHTSRML